MIARLPWTLFWALSGQAILSVTRFFSKMVVGGKLSSDQTPGLGSSAELGYYEATFGVMMLIIGIHEALVTTPMTFFHHKTKTTDDRKLAGRMLTISMIFSVLALIGFLTVCGYRYITATEHLGLTITLLAVSILLPLQLIREFVRRWLLADLQVKQSALLELLSAGLFVACLAFLVMTQTVTAASMFAITAIANLVCLACWWMIYRQSFDVGLGDLHQQLKKNLGYGKWIACENLCSVAMVYFSQWFLLAKIGADGVGIYTACVTVVLLANPFLLGVASLFAPRSAQEFNRSGWTGLLRMLGGYSLFVGAVLTGFSVVIYFYGDPITHLFFGTSQYEAYFQEKFNGINTTTFLLSIAMPCFGISFLLANCLLAADVPMYSCYAALIGLLTTVVANFCFIEPTINTAATSFVLGAVATTLARAVLVWWTHRQQTRLA